MRDETHKKGSSYMIYIINVPIRTVSEGNSREHWRKSHARHKSQKLAVSHYLKKDKPNITLPCKITLTRIAPRALDSDNLQFSLKYIRDATADYIKPGLQAGRADDDKGMEWVYSQEKGKPKTYGIRIEIDCGYQD